MSNFGGLGITFKATDMNVGEVVGGVRRDVSMMESTTEAASEEMSDQMAEIETQAADKLSTVTSKVKEVGGAIKETATRDLLEPINSAIDELGTVGSKIKQQFSRGFEAIKSKVVDVGGTVVKTAALQGKKAGSEMGSQAGEASGSMFSDVFSESASEGVTEGLTKTGLGSKIVSSISGMFSGVSVSGLVSGLTTVLSTAAIAAAAIFGPILISKLEDSFPAIKQEIKEMVSDLIMGAKSALKSLVDFSEFWRGAASNMFTNIQSMISQLPGLMRNVFNQITSAISDMAPMIEEILTNVMVGLFGLIVDLVENLPSIIATNIQITREMIVGIANMVIELVTQIVSRIPSILASIHEKVFKMLGDLTKGIPLVEEFFGVLESSARRLKQVYNSLGRNIRQFTDSMKSGLNTLVKYSSFGLMGAAEAGEEAKKGQDKAAAGAVSLKDNAEEAMKGIKGVTDATIEADSVIGRWAESQFEASEQALESAEAQFKQSIALQKVSHQQQILEKRTNKLTEAGVEWTDTQKQLAAQTQMTEMRALALGRQFMEMGQQLGIAVDEQQKILGQIRQYPKLFNRARTDIQGFRQDIQVVGEAMQFFNLGAEESVDMLHTFQNMTGQGRKAMNQFTNAAAKFEEEFQVPGLLKQTAPLIEQMQDRTLEARSGMEDFQETATEAMKSVAVVAESSRFQVEEITNQVSNLHSTMADARQQMRDYRLGLEDDMGKPTRDLMLLMNQTGRTSQDAFEMIRKSADDPAKSVEEIGKLMSDLNIATGKWSEMSFQQRKNLRLMQRQFGDITQSVRETAKQHGSWQKAMEEMDPDEAIDNQQMKSRRELMKEQMSLQKQQLKLSKQRMKMMITQNVMMAEDQNKALDRMTEKWSTLSETQKKGLRHAAKMTGQTEELNKQIKETNVEKAETFRRELRLKGLGGRAEEISKKLKKKHDVEKFKELTKNQIIEGVKQFAPEQVVEQQKEQQEDFVTEEDMKESSRSNVMIKQLKSRDMWGAVEQFRKQVRETFGVEKVEDLKKEQIKRGVEAFEDDKKISKGELKKSDLSADKTRTASIDKSEGADSGDRKMAVESEERRGREGGGEADKTMQHLTWDGNIYLKATEFQGVMEKVKNKEKTNKTELKGR